MAIQSNRTLGGIGAGFTVVGAVSSVLSIIQYAYPSSVAANLVFVAVSGVIGVFAFIGFILFLIAMYGFSRDYSERRIFNYILYGLVFAIVAGIFVGAIMVIVFFANIVSIIPGISTVPSTPSDMQPLFLPYFAPFMVVFGFIGLVYVVFTVRALNLLADKSEVPLFTTGAKVLLAGALVTIVLGVMFTAFAATGLISFSALSIMAIPGGLLQEVAWFLLAIAFFRIRAPTQTFEQYNAPTVAGQVKYCPNCGTPNQADAVYCTRCGNKL